MKKKNFSLNSDYIDFEILVNRENLLSESFEPNDLIATDDNKDNFHNYIDPTKKPEISNSIFQYFLQMQSEAAEEGLGIIIDSGYRSYNYQKNVMESKIQKLGLEEAYKLVAPPGASEHQTGLAFDISLFRNGEYIEDVNPDDKEVIWLMNNSYKYGFILRYPEGKEDITGFNFEPWHFRFVGLRLAKILHDNDITMEEYYAKKQFYDNIDKEKSNIEKK